MRIIESDSQAKHQQEWLNSCVDEEIYHLNVRSLSGTLQGIPQTLNQIESPATQGLQGLKLKMQQGLDCAGQFYSELVSTIGSAVGVADGEPYWNGYLGQWLSLG